MADTIADIIKAEAKLAEINAEIKKAEAKLAKINAALKQGRVIDSRVIDSASRQGQESRNA